MDKGIVVIGDVHGCYDTLLALIQKVKEQFPNDQIVISGDLCDRGPKSREVVQYVIDNDILCTMGNHEWMMYREILNVEGHDDGWGLWSETNGEETMDSYKDHPEQLQTHAIWMSQLPLFLEFKDVYKIGDDTDHGCKRHLVVSHSAIGSVWNWSEQTKKDCQKEFEQEVLWGRYNEQESEEIFNVFGHTPQADGPSIKSFYANIDTGAVFNRVHYGKLTALHYPTMTVIQQENIDTK